MPGSGGRGGLRPRRPRTSCESLLLPPSHRIGVVCAFVTNQRVHEHMGPSVEAVPETLLSLRDLVSDIPQVSTGKCARPGQVRAEGPFQRAPDCPCWRVAVIAAVREGKGGSPEEGRPPDGLCLPRSCRQWRSSSPFPRVASWRTWMVRTRAGWPLGQPQGPLPRPVLRGPLIPHPGLPREHPHRGGTGLRWAAQQAVCRRAGGAVGGSRAPGSREQPSDGLVLFRCRQEPLEHSPQPAQEHGA